MRIDGGWQLLEQTQTFENNKSLLRWLKETQVQNPQNELTSIKSHALP
jgi:hypothetical protein